MMTCADTGVGNTAAVESGNEALWAILSARRPLPLRFVLHPSRRLHRTLCPCLQIELPSLAQARSVHAGCGYDGHQDSHTVIRILDPEHKVPYVSLSPIFRAAGLSTVQGLLLLHLDPRLDYDLSLAGLEPWDDLWASFKIATQVAKQLDLYARLSALLDSRTKHAWSLDEGSRGVSHNWKVPAESLDPAIYSAEALLTSPGFSKIDVLKDGEQLSTLVSFRQRHEIQAQDQKKTVEHLLREKLVRWSHACYTAWIDVAHARDSLLNAQDTTESSSESTQKLSLDLARNVLQDIDARHISPTLQDVQEWLQLFVPIAVKLERPASSPDDILAPLSSVELLHLKRMTNLTEDNARHAAKTYLSGMECLKSLQDLQLELRAKMGLVHRMEFQFAQRSCRPSPYLVEDTAGQLNQVPAEAVPSRSHATITSPYQDLLDSIDQAVKCSVREQFRATDSRSTEPSTKADLQLVLQKLDHLVQHVDRTASSIPNQEAQAQGSDETRCSRTDSGSSKGKCPNSDRKEAVPPRKMFQIKDLTSSLALVFHLTIAICMYWVVRQQV